MFSMLNAAEVAQQGSKMEVLLMNLLPFVFIFAIFYFLLIRPQKNKQKKHMQLLESLKSGDKVLLSSGIVAKVVKVKDNGYLIVSIADNVEIEILKSYIVSVFDK